MTAGRTAKRTVYAMLCAVGFHHLARKRNRRRLLVVTYHGLRAGPAPRGTDWSLLPVDRFEQQIAYLARYYRVRLIDEALAELRSPAGLSEPTACITFDDGYRSNHRLALPILQRYGVPATVYLATGMVGTGRLLWTLELDLAFQQTSRTEIDLTALGEGRVALCDETTRARAARRVIGRLKPLGPVQRAALLDPLREQLAVHSVDHGGAFDMMGWEEVRDMEASGLVTFGGHTVNHEILSRLDGFEVESEVFASVATVVEKVGRHSKTFAYPNGTAEDFDDRAVRAVRQAGSIGAVSTIEGLSDAGTDPYAIRRFNVGSDMDHHEFRLLTSGALRRRARV